MCIRDSTSFDQKHWDVYARRCLESHYQHWYPSWQLVAYTNMEALLESNPFKDRNFWFLPLPETVAAFKASAPKAATGTVPQPCWSRRDHEKGYSHRTDAVRFCHKPLVLVDFVASQLKHEPLVPCLLYTSDAADE